MGDHDNVQRPDDSDKDWATGQPQSTTSEPAYAGAQGQQQPGQPGERPDGAGQEDPSERMPSEIDPKEGPQAFPGPAADPDHDALRDDPERQPAS